MKRSSLIWMLLAGTLAACAQFAAPLPPAPVRPNGQTLWRIIHDQCLPALREGRGPGPCVSVAISEGEAHGYVLLKDRTGVAQHLLMPTAKITGIEDPAVLAADAPNYFAKAWDARGLLDQRLGRALPREDVAIAVNSVYGRTQDQLHLHIDCVDATVRDALKGVGTSGVGRWNARRLTLKGHRYQLAWLDQGGLQTTNPFKLLAASMPGARQGMGGWTLALIGGADARGRPGFYLLADRVDLGAGDRASAEDLQDHDCRL